MGAYLSEPVLEKHSTDEDGEFMAYGASSMQGWRVSQEDAHNSILSYDGGKSLFAVYDGHGGHEVAEYCSKYLPEYIKQNANFKSGNYEKALEECFIGFDATLVDRKVVATLKVIAGTEDDDKEDEEAEVNNLCEEATMPIEDVIKKLNSGESVGKPLNPLLAGLKGEKKPFSPFLRGKQTGSVLGEGGSGAAFNKHIRFNESGTEIDENGEVTGDGEKPKDKPNCDEVNGEAKEEQKVNGEVKEEAVKVNGDVKNEVKENGLPEVSSSPEGSEKENKDTNGAPPPASDIKGKGKGKGKGKSSKVKSSDSAAATAGEAVAAVAEKKTKKSADEIYTSLLKTAPESGDEDSEDSDDQEFGGDVDSDDDDEEGIEAEEDVEDEDDEEDSDLEDEEEDDEEGLIEADFTEEPGNDSGCTAVLALMAGTKLIVANAGDSRCVVCRDGKAVEMSADHKPEDDIEHNRIKNAGGKVTPDGRVNGGLNLSRALGDHAYKQNKTLALKDQMISPQPDLRVHDIKESDSWMILACDGIWNFMTSQEVVTWVDARMKDTPDDKLSSICEELFDHCLAPDTMGDGTGCDNMTAVIVRFKPKFQTVKDIVTDPSASSSSSGGSSSSSGGSSGSGGSSSKPAAASEPATSSGGSVKRDSEESEAAPQAKKLKLDSE